MSNFFSKYMKKTRSNQPGALFFRRWPSFFVVGILLVGLLGLSRPAQAIVTTTATDITSGILKLKQSSAVNAVVKVQFGSDSNGENLNALAMVFTGTAGTPTWTNGAVTSSELADLAATDGGVELWKDGGAAGFQGTGVDTQITLSAPTYGAAGSLILTPASPPALVTDDIYYVVIKTDTTGVTSGNAFTVTVPTDGVVTSVTPPTITLLTTAAITMDTVAPTIDTNSTGPANGSTGVPISAFIHVGLSENLDQ